MGILKKIEVWFVGMFGGAKKHPSEEAAAAAAGNTTQVAVLDATIASLKAQSPAHGEEGDEKESEGGSITDALGCDKE